jgi:uncharacterized membrane protein YqgA involved in biofilm formation
MLGTLINAAAVIVGGVIGLLIHSRLPKRITTIIFQGIGLFTLFLGISMAAKTNEYLIMIFSIVLGSITGELINVEKYLNTFSNYLKRKVGSDNSKFSEGFITSFMLFCVGSTLGIGVIFSVIPMLLFQGGLTLFAGSLEHVLSNTIINELSAVGGLLLIGLGLNILEIKQLKITNMLPSLLIVILLTYLFA